MFDLVEVLLNIYEAHLKEEISDDERELLLECAYSEYTNQFIEEFTREHLNIDQIISEAVEDTDYAKTGFRHVSKVRNHVRNVSPPKGDNFDSRAAQDKKNMEALPNKKFKKKKDGSYVNPEKARKAELKYQAADKDYTTSKGVEHHYNSSYGSDEIDKKITPSDKKMIEYMRKQAKKGDEASIKKYKQVYKMFCTKYGIEPDSSIHVRIFGTSSDPTSDMKITEVKSGKEMTKKDTGAQDKKSLNPFKKAEPHAIPKGYMLIHMSSTDKIKELKPSTNLRSSHTDAEQFHDKGRVYFYLYSEKDVKEKVKKAKKGDATGGYGNHIYTPSGGIASFFVDNERGTEHQAFRDLGVKGFAATRSPAVFVKTDTPIKVKQLC